MPPSFGYAPPDELAPAARRLFGDGLPLAAAYAELLVTDGVIRGLIGPREAPRVWGRHLLNCAALAEFVQPDSYVVDVGSGAGLPGIVLAVARPDLTVVLIEPLARRTAFLDIAVSELDLSGRVTVVRGRAESTSLPRQADVVTARAVAPLDRLAGWCLPLAALGGRLLALKGASAVDEVAAHSEAVAALGGGPPAVRLGGAGLLDPPATIVEVVRERVVPEVRRKAARSGGRPSRESARSGREAAGSGGRSDGDSAGLGGRSGGGLARPGRESARSDGASVRSRGRPSGESARSDGASVRSRGRPSGESAGFGGRSDGESGRSAGRLGGESGRDGRPDDGVGRPGRTAGQRRGGPQRWSR
jgi:16S rRNA (guanine527-N7)-methyltransferase